MYLPTEDATTPRSRDYSSCTLPTRLSDRESGFQSPPELFSRLISQAIRYGQRDFRGISDVSFPSENASYPCGSVLMCRFKRSAAYTGDSIFEAPRRHTLLSAQKHGLANQT